MDSVRCAIYTRKSVEEGLDQEFNTLDAQRLACESYIAAKRMEGWVCLPEHYDDGGYSGGDTKRPAYQRMMADVEAGKIDMIVVYKIDRLSRSLADFTNAFVTLEKHHASLASVTQELNTSNSMGRMVMNLLMTFAQFERELTADRTRDKMAATRRQGLWCGGTVPYGYRLENKRLFVVPEKAAVVRKIFQKYLDEGSPKAIAKYLRCSGVMKDSAKGRYWDTVAISTCLRNCVYAGQLPFKEERFKGLHDPIIEKSVWDAVQAKLKEADSWKQSRKRASQKASSSEALLAGLVRCGHCGDALSFTWTKKTKDGVRKYAYYTCRKNTRSGAQTCPVRSVSAQMIEPLVEEEVLRFLRTPTMVRKAAQIECRTPYEINQRLSDAEAFWSGMTAIQRRDLVRSIVGEVKVYESSIEIRIKTNGNQRLIEELKDEHHDIG